MPYVSDTFSSGSSRVTAALLTAVAAALLLAPSESNAFLCPAGPGPGQIPIGVAKGPGFNGALICAHDPNAPASSSPYEDAARDREEAAQHSRDVRRSAIESLTRMVEISKAMQRSMKDIDPNLILPVSDPDYVQGYWTFPGETGRKAKPGEYCRMIFASSKGVVGIFGPGGDYRGAMLMFWGGGEAIPKPKALKLVPVSLLQNGETQTADRQSLQLHRAVWRCRDDRAGRAFRRSADRRDGGEADVPARDGRQGGRGYVLE